MTFDEAMQHAPPERDLATIEEDFRTFFHQLRDLGGAGPREMHLLTLGLEALRSANRRQKQLQNLFTVARNHTTGGQSRADLETALSNAKHACGLR